MPCKYFSVKRWREHTLPTDAVKSVKLWMLHEVTPYNNNEVFTHKADAIMYKINSGSGAAYDKNWK